MRQLAEATRAVDARTRREVLGWLALTSESLRTDALDALVGSGALPARARALVPDRAALARSLEGALAKHPQARALLRPEMWFARKPCLRATWARATSHAITIACGGRGCGHSCLVLEGSAEIVVHESGRILAHGVAVRSLGDTGECGCCTGQMLDL